MLPAPLPGRGQSARGASRRVTRALRAPRVPIALGSRYLGELLTLILSWSRSERSMAAFRNSSIDHAYTPEAAIG